MNSRVELKQRCIMPMVNSDYCVFRKVVIVEPIVYLPARGLSDHQGSIQAISTLQIIVGVPIMGTNITSMESKKVKSSLKSDHNYEIKHCLILSPTRTQKKTQNSIRRGLDLSRGCGQNVPQKWTRRS